MGSPQEVHPTTMSTTSSTSSSSGTTVTPNGMSTRRYYGTLCGVGNAYAHMVWMSTHHPYYMSGTSTCGSMLL